MIICFNCSSDTKRSLDDPFLYWEVCALIQPATPIGCVELHRQSTPWTDPEDGTEYEFWSTYQYLSPVRHWSQPVAFDMVTLTLRACSVGPENCSQWGLLDVWWPEVTTIGGE